MFKENINSEDFSPTQHTTATDKTIRRKEHSYDNARHHQQSHTVMHSRTTHMQSHTHAIAHAYLATATEEQISINQPYIYMIPYIYKNNQQQSILEKSKICHTPRGCVRYQTLYPGRENCHPYFSH